MVGGKNVESGVEEKENDGNVESDVESVVQCGAQLSFHSIAHSPFSLHLHSIALSIGWLHSRYCLAFFAFLLCFLL